MPYSKKAHGLFEAAAHNPAVAKRVGIPQQTAKRLASEGVKRPAMTPMRKSGRGR